LVNDLQSAANDAKDYDACVSTARKLLKADPSVPELLYQANDKLCHCHLQTGDHSSSLEHCTAALKQHEEPRILCDRAEVHIALDMLDEAQQDYAKALEVDEHNQRAKEGLQKVQKLQKQAKKRDYYKILGVRKNANKKEIIKAYRKAAQQWHPDNFQGEQKKMAENKFIDIAAAKEVLTDPGKILLTICGFYCTQPKFFHVFSVFAAVIEKRQKYDSGEDPLDPESQQGQGFNPFAQGGFPHFHSQGGPFQFKFHFN